uniref:AlNc14C241G9474 protein n=1 Tax=Albugo laibachii Nc14 TaxID=890382 RepID=F0WSY5_9STRA|nr:AlNc14C241G9474 [Albugo laibachii Nc14]|eukprot:CCA24469.1 AlNc14C241G9474 [Albugo laibachii Nc14]
MLHAAQSLGAKKSYVPLDSEWRYPPMMRPVPWSLEILDHEFKESEYHRKHACAE